MAEGCVEDSVAVWGSACPGDEGAFVGGNELTHE